MALLVLITNDWRFGNPFSGIEQAASAEDSRRQVQLDSARDAPYSHTFLGAILKRCPELREIRDAKLETSGVVREKLENHIEQPAIGLPPCHASRRDKPVSRRGKNLPLVQLRCAAARHPGPVMDGF